MARLSRTGEKYDEKYVDMLYFAISSWNHDWAQYNNDNNNNEDILIRRMQKIYAMLRDVIVSANANNLRKTRSHHYHVPNSE